MPNIINNIKTFVRELRSGKSLRVTSEGDFYVTYKLISFAESILGLDLSRWIQVSRAFRRVLRELESVPISINISNSHAAQDFNYELFIEAGNALIEKLTAYENERSKHEKTLLERELVALLYRLEYANGGLSPTDVCSNQFNALIEAASLWKSSQVVFHDLFLSVDDRNVLREACRYGEFVNIILANQNILEDFLEWSLRDRLPPRLFIEFPSIQQKIKDFDLNGRIGRMGGNKLKVLYIQRPEDPEGILQKVVTLPMEGKDISILDDRRIVVFRGSYALTVREIFEEFAKKRTGDSNLEFMAEGIINWNAFHWGWWDQNIRDWRLVDLDQPQWWKQLPEIEVLSLKDAREKFGAHLDGRCWNVAAIATRERATLDFEGAHAYSSIAIPEEGGSYAVYPFGKYALKFSSNLVRALLNVGETTEATIAYPDENVYYTHRQRSRFSFALTPTQGLAYLESVKNDMLTARAGNLVYQIESENCAKWTHKKIEGVVGPHRIPNVFQMPFLHSEPHGIMERVFAWIHKLPPKWHQPVTLCIHFLFGGYKGLWIWEEGRRVWKSLTTHSFWDDTVIYHPSMLLKQQELGIIGRFVSQGVTFSKSHILRSYHGLHHKMVLFGNRIMKEGREALRQLMASLQALLSSKEKIVSLEDIAFLQMDEQFSTVQNESEDVQTESSSPPAGGTECALKESFGLTQGYKAFLTG